MRCTSSWAAACGLVLHLACGGANPSGPSTPAPTPSATPTPDPGPPNIVLILADDMGYGDLGVYGNTRARTPHLDRLAAEGARFESFYVSSPVCAPSRAALLTGRWPPRTGILWNPPTRLDGDEVLIAESLREAGYATGMVGKWHLGWTAQEMPIHYGFDFYYGIINGIDENDFRLGDQPTRDTVAPDQFARRFTQEALRFIASRRGQPFFMYVSHREPHLPSLPPPDYAGRSASGAYGDSLEWLDANVGDLMKGLADLGVDHNTLVVFLSDNGPPPGAGSAGPLSGGKFSCEEGGIRVPAIVRWPARVRRGRVIREIASAVDLFPTLLSAARARPATQHLDGVDLSRLLTGEVERIGGQGIDGGRELVFWQQYGRPGGLRSGRYKYLRPGLWSHVPTLFDLEADPGEQIDLAPSRPELAQQLESRLQELLAAH